MFDQRLPAVNGDDGAWGDILNQYLSKEHYNTGLNNVANGSHKTITIQPGTIAAGTAPLKFTSGPLLTTPEAGAIEYLTDTFYIRGTDNISIAGSITAGSVVKSSGTSSQFLKADGTVDSSNYATKGFAIAMAIALK